MADPIKLQTPMGEISIPYNEDAILSFYRKMVKVNDGDPDLLEENYVDFMKLSSPAEAISDWVFWEESRTPIYIYDFMGWIAQDFEVAKTLGFSMSKTKETGLQYHQFTYPHGKENMPIRGSFFLERKSDGAKYVVDLTPVDGLHIEVQIIHEMSTSVKEFHEGFKEYGEKHGILKNNSVNANLEFINIEKVGWDDVVLSNEQREAFEKNVVNFITHMDYFADKKLPTSRGCLLTGPPGTGKTLTCSAIMNQIESTIIYITSDEIQQRGQIAELYEIARQVAPTIMVVEDIDTLGGLDRTKGGDHPILGEFLNCLAGVESNSGVVTIATTNYPEHLDKALVDRPGRFDFRIDFGLPDDKLRKWILKKYLSTFDHDNVDFKALIKDTKGMTGAHLKEMVTMAYMDALEASNYKKTTKISQDNLVKSMKAIIENRAKYHHYKNEDSHASILHG